MKQPEYLYHAPGSCITCPVLNEDGQYIQIKNLSGESITIVPGAVKGAKEMKKAKATKLTVEELEQRFVEAIKLQEERMYNLLTELFKQQSLVADLKYKEHLRVQKEEAAELDRQENAKLKERFECILMTALITAVFSIIITAACLAS